MVLKYCSPLRSLTYYEEACLVPILLFDVGVYLEEAKAHLGLTLREIFVIYFSHFVSVSQ